MLNIKELKKLLNKEEKAKKIQEKYKEEHEDNKYTVELCDKIIKEIDEKINEYKKRIENEEDKLKEDKKNNRIIYNHNFYEAHKEIYYKKKDYMICPLCEKQITKAYEKKHVKLYCKANKK